MDKMGFSKSKPQGKRNFPNTSNPGPKKRRLNSSQKQHILEQGTSKLTLGNARSVDVESFVESRSFEINALQKSLEAARSSGNTRAFQSLPRHLRRRAASHNVKRLPVKLRAKAINEMQKSAQSSKKLSESGQLTNAKKSNRYKRRRTRTIREEFMLRQRGKRWLETHMWHAKRMHMKELWGVMIAESPNERSHRASYRAAMNKVFIEDVSFYSTVKLSGDAKAILELVGAMVPPKELTISMDRYYDGSRIAPLTLYRANMYPNACLGPAMALWKPKDEADKENRTLLLRIHPAITKDVIDEVNLIKETQNSVVEVEDATANLVAFELLGNQSTQLLSDMLIHSADPESAGAKTLRKIRRIPNPATLPEGVVVSLYIQDPRLRFPIKFKPESKAALTESDTAEINEVLAQWPSDCSHPTEANGEIWDTEKCLKDVERRPTDHQLNQRRSEQLVPGKKLEPKEDVDVNVPILLIRTGPESISGSQIIDTNSEYIDNLAHGWTLIAPKGWAMPLWLTFVFAGARAQGLNERCHLGLEAGLPFFPNLWPGTKAYDQWTGPIAADKYKRWLNRPPAKRTNYVEFGVTWSPFFPDVHRLVNTRLPKEYPVIEKGDLECRMSRLRKIHKDKRLKKKQLLEAAKDNNKEEDEMQVDETNNAAAAEERPVWLVSGENAVHILRRMMVRQKCCTGGNGDAEFLQWAEPLLAYYRSGMRGRQDSVDLDRALVRVRLLCTGRGTPEFSSPIYFKRSDDGTDSPNIGYILAGSFSLARGCSMAIGACSVKGLYEMWRTARKASSVLFKNPDGSPERNASLLIIP